MILKPKKCHACGVLGVGPRAVKLHPLDDLLYCERGTPEKPGCWRLALRWHEQRPLVTAGLQRELSIYDRPRAKKKSKSPDWRGHIQELCDLAAWGLLVGDRRTFVYYASRAILAWGLREVQDDQV